MKNILYLLILAGGLLFACRQDKPALPHTVKGAVDTTQLEGAWVGVGGYIYYTHDLGYDSPASITDPYKKDSKERGTEYLTFKRGKQIFYTKLSNNNNGRGYIDGVHVDTSVMNRSYGNYQIVNNIIYCTDTFYNDAWHNLEGYERIFKLLELTDNKIRGVWRTLGPGPFGLAVDDYSEYKKNTKDE